MADSNDTFHRPEAAQTSSGGAAVNQCAAICRRPGNVTGSGIEILLITSRDTQRWVIPKGWSMAKKKPHQVARREAWEEAGVRGQVSKTPLGYYRYDKKMPEGERVQCLVQVHLLDVAALYQDFPEKGQRELRWFSPAEAARAVKEPGLQDIFRRLYSQEI